jgi:endonuclease/exonuclease/phosphatase family metal-dependent hydrolase
VPLADSWRVLYPDEPVAGTFNSFSGYSDGPKIDYIFTTPDTRVLDAAIIRTRRNGHCPSDHDPVTARLRFESRTPESGSKKQRLPR